MTPEPDLSSIVERLYPDLPPVEQIYKDIHQNPKLGTQEIHTSSIIAKHLHGLEFRVHESTGGHGLVRVLKNGTGLTLLLRADMDAFPIREQTGIPYASTVIRV